jgi:hypothetical protein
MCFLKFALNLGKFARLIFSTVYQHQLSTMTEKNNAVAKMILKYWKDKEFHAIEQHRQEIERVQQLSPRYLCVFARCLLVSLFDCFFLMDQLLLLLVYESM